MLTFEQQKELGKSIGKKCSSLHFSFQMRANAARIPDQERLIEEMQQADLALNALLRMSSHPDTLTALGVPITE